MTAINLKTLTKEDINEFFNSFDTVLTDCDGVLWTYMTPMNNAAKVLNVFRDLGKRVFYVTNNSMKTQDEFAEKCKMLNFTATKNEILCTAHLSASYLKDLGFQKKVYIIGSEAIAKELNQVGIPHYGVGPDPVSKDAHYTDFVKDPEVGAVIVGFDEHFSYPKMIKAATYLNDPKVHFIGTNKDTRFPISGHIVIPGTGTFVNCIESCTNRKAVIMGKPECYLSTVLTKQFNINPQRTLMIGDFCHSDILLGTRCGFKTLLVLTGVTTLEDIHKYEKSDCKEDKDLVPNYYIDAIGDLLPYLKNQK